MSSKPIDTKLARILQKRGTWPNYIGCLMAVRGRLIAGESPNQIREEIAAGKLDFFEPKKGTT